MIKVSNCTNILPTQFVINDEWCTLLVNLTFMKFEGLVPRRSILNKLDYMSNHTWYIQHRLTLDYFKF